MEAQSHLSWAPRIPVGRVAVGGAWLRYITVGSGPALVLLHTLRTQLDMFQKVVPELESRFRVYAPDYPGHGGSDAPDADYSAEFLVASVAEFLDRLDIRDAIVAGESIGGSIALLLAARRDPRVRGVMAVNPYDYDRGRGLRRSSMLANLVIAASGVPGLGTVVRHVQPYAVVARILEGGVHRRGAFPAALLHELHDSGKAPGHPRAFMRLVRHWPSWERARAEYGNIAVPVLLLYGDHDWSRDEEREADRRAIPGATMRVVADAGHFLALDAPDAFIQGVTELEARLPP
ncbi:MAG TPA: alpha/beta hydrolase [Gemmatimonadaceae bacterium]|nr:alpha/beta hydrolase [Gemmatimonadaceae bacterium]